MKIGFDAKRAFNNTAGLGNFSRNTIAALACQYPDDRFFLFNPSQNKTLFIAPENSLELNPDGFWWKLFPNLWRSFRIGNKSVELNLDIYHGLSHELPLGIEYTGIKTLVTIHDLVYIRYPEYFKKVDRVIYNKKFRNACRIATCIHAISEQTKFDLNFFFDVPDKKIVVIYQAINPLFFSEITDAHRLAVLGKYQFREPFLLTVGTIEPRKNLMGLLKGMLSAKIHLPLVVVGKPTDYMQEIQQLIDLHATELKVFFLSSVDDADLHVLYQSAAVMIYPSVFEGFGLPVAEAQASGCPVITSKISSLPEAGGDAALYIDPRLPEGIGIAIKGVLNKPNLRNSLIVKGRVNAKRFTPENYARQMKQLYNSILND